MEELKAQIIAQRKRFWQTCIWSLAGWRASWRSEATLRQWSAANVVSAGLAMMVTMSNIERILIIAFGLLVLVVELLNTAVEEAVNHTSLKEHPLARKAKDAGSAAVAMAAITAGVVWLLVLLG